MLPSLGSGALILLHRALVLSVRRQHQRILGEYVPRILFVAQESEPDLKWVWGQHSPMRSGLAFWNIKRNLDTTDFADVFCHGMYLNLTKDSFRDSISDPSKTIIRLLRLNFPWLLFVSITISGSGRLVLQNCPLHGAQVRRSLGCAL